MATGVDLVLVRIAYIEPDESEKRSNPNSIASWTSAYEKRNANGFMRPLTSPSGPLSIGTDCPTPQLICVKCIITAQIIEITRLR